MGRKLHGPINLDEFETLSLDIPVKEQCELIGGLVIQTLRERTAAHHLIVDNIVSGLLTAFRDSGSRYRAVGRPFWLKHRALRLAVLPDVMIHEGRLFPSATSLDDPIVIFDIDTGEAAAAARAEKWKLYKSLKSLQHYVVVGRNMAGVDVFERIDGGWFFRPRLELMSSELTLPWIDIALPLAKIYRDVEFG